jgi:hypothetical protein
MPAALQASRLPPEVQSDMLAARNRNRSLPSKCSAEPAARAGEDHTAASLIPAFPDLQMNCLRVKEIGLIERDLGL